jgi:V8-like Glu-specific endopeptidase
MPPSSGSPWYYRYACYSRRTYAFGHVSTCLSNITKISIDELQNLPEWQPEMVLYSLCENDDRKPVMNTTTVPWRWICKLIITFPDGGKLAGTGFFIGSKAVMTAGHCVYSRERGGWANEIMVIPGMMGESLPFGSITATSFRSNEGWIKNQDSNYDYGCIILPSPELGNQVGYFGFAALDDDSLKDLLVNNSGYPGDKPAGTQWFNAGRVTNITA